MRRILSIIFLFAIMTLNLIPYTSNATYVRLQTYGVQYSGSTRHYVVFYQPPYGRIEVWIKYYDSLQNPSSSHIYFAITYVNVLSGMAVFGSNYRIDWVDVDFYIDTPYRSPNRQYLRDRGPGNGWDIYYCTNFGLYDYRAYVDLDYSGAYVSYCYYAPPTVTIVDRSTSVDIQCFHDISEGSSTSAAYEPNPGYAVETYNYINGYWRVYVNALVNAQFVEICWFWTCNPYQTGWILTYVDYPP